MKRLSLIMLMGVILLSCQREEEGVESILYSPMERTAVYHPTFVWESVGDMYHLQVSADSLFSSAVINEENLTDTAFTPEDTLQEARYYWRVRAKKDTWGEWSNVGSFFVVVSPPGLIFPPDADTVKFPTLVWNATEGADNYHLYVYQGDIAAGVSILDTILPDTSYTITDTLDPATYRWMVEVDGVWSDTFRFVTYTLAETFFPVGPDYIWEYKETYYSWGWFGDSRDTTYYSIEVKEFIWEGDSLYVELSRRHYFTGDIYIYRNDTVFFYDDGRLMSLSLMPYDGEPMYDHAFGQERPDLHADKNTDSTFMWGWGWGELPYQDGWRYEYWQKGKGMYLYDEGEDWHPNDPDGDPRVGAWSRRRTLINLDKGD